MRWVDRLAWSGLLIAASCVATAQQQSEYNRVDTFQPGKKYNCVPTADRKGWDCKELGKATASDTAPQPKPATTTAIPETAPPSPPQQHAASSVPPMPTELSDKPTTLPSYLRAAPSATPAPAAPVEKAPTATPTPAPTPQPAVTIAPVAPPAPVPSPTKTETPQQDVSAKPALSPAPAPPLYETAAAPASSLSSKGNREFLSLPASSYVIELAHSANRSDIDALRDSLQLPRGDLYKLHLSRDGGDWWVLLWGSFDNMAAARTARGELATNAAINAGWPRLVAPLQNEARRRLEQ